LEGHSFVAPCRTFETFYFERIFQVFRGTRSMLAAHRYKPRQDSTPTPTTTHQLTNKVALLMISKKLHTLKTANLQLYFFHNQELVENERDISDVFNMHIDGMRVRVFQTA
jgi:hypothetical protein